MGVRLIRQNWLRDLRWSRWVSADLVTARTSNLRAEVRLLPEPFTRGRKGAFWLPVERAAPETRCSAPGRARSITPETLPQRRTIIVLEPLLG